MMPASRPGHALPQIFLTPGALYYGREPALVTTVLGSCVSVCLWDHVRRLGGINHYVLPHATAGDCSSRYGDVALEMLWKALGELGCHPESLRAKLFGGAAVLPFGAADATTIGDTNVHIAKEWLNDRAIPLLAARTGGRNGLVIRFDTGSGRVLARPIDAGAAVHTGVDGTT